MKACNILLFFLKCVTTFWVIKLLFLLCCHMECVWFRKTRVLAVVCTGKSKHLKSFQNLLVQELLLLIIDSFYCYSHCINFFVIFLCIWAWWLDVHHCSSFEVILYVTSIWCFSTVQLCFVFWLYASMSVEHTASISKAAGHHLFSHCHENLKLCDYSILNIHISWLFYNDKQSVLVSTWNNR
jgi:hypothetical protein